MTLVGSSPGIETMVESCYACDHCMLGIGMDIVAPGVSIVVLEELLFWMSPCNIAIVRHLVLETVVVHERCWVNAICWSEKTLRMAAQNT